MSKQAIDAVPAQPPRYGLLVAASVIADETRWEIGGVAWSPEGCNGGGVMTVDCGSTEQLVIDNNPANAEADPFGVWAGDKCSTFGFKARDYEGRARRLLAATESFHIAHELWTGDLSVAEGLDNEPLASAGADTVTAAASAVDVVTAFGLLDGALAACGAGRRGMLHVTPQVLLHARSQYLVELSGQQWITPLGTIVVADAGYDGSGPNGENPGTTQWAYATSMVQVRLSPIDVVPGSFADAVARAQAVDRSVNTVELRAERLALVQWDACCHFAAQIDLDVPLTGGVS